MSQMSLFGGLFGMRSADLTFADAFHLAMRDLPNASSFCQTFQIYLITTMKSILRHTGEEVNKWLTYHDEAGLIDWEAYSYVKPFVAGGILCFSPKSPNVSQAIQTPTPPPSPPSQFLSGLPSVGSTGLSFGPSSPPYSAPVSQSFGFMGKYSATQDYGISQNFGSMGKYPVTKDSNTSHFGHSLGVASNSISSHPIPSALLSLGEKLRETRARKDRTKALQWVAAKRHHVNEHIGNFEKNFNRGQDCTWPMCMLATAITAAVAKLDSHLTDLNAAELEWLNWPWEHLQTIFRTIATSMDDPRAQNLAQALERLAQHCIRARQTPGLCYIKQENHVFGTWNPILGSQEFQMRSGFSVQQPTAQPSIEENIPSTPVPPRPVSAPLSVGHSLGTSSIPNSFVDSDCMDIDQQPEPQPFLPNIPQNTSHQIHKDNLFWLKGKRQAVRTDRRKLSKKLDTNEDYDDRLYTLKELFREANDRLGKDVTPLNNSEVEWIEWSPEKLNVLLQKMAGTAKVYQSELFLEVGRELETLVGRLQTALNTTGTCAMVENSPQQQPPPTQATSTQEEQQPSTLHQLSLPFGQQLQSKAGDTPAVDRSTESQVQAQAQSGSQPSDAEVPHYTTAEAKLHGENLDYYGRKGRRAELYCEDILNNIADSVDCQSPGRSLLAILRETNKAIQTDNIPLNKAEVEWSHWSWSPTALFELYNVVDNFPEPREDLVKELVKELETFGPLINAAMLREGVCTEAKLKATPKSSVSHPPKQAAPSATASSSAASPVTPPPSLSAEEILAEAQELSKYALPDDDDDDFWKD
ncbi:uncharacterized protein BDZ99DRAFT_551300 [Mytilinidion resinicola]|uniref:Uncharacterized protein n=1 Tax=Mytilinidion resinicola TaxID=574789 RepID=A0A6A6Y382_9PEZI|nr:uncharacterized protein BDZ99DRAFT_551300 [Mytilinidion resinicola]KAF2802474.1 hypothetical protein BDZ99DRAFT_551300 [Mytilinidion resinicola]